MTERSSGREGVMLLAAMLFPLLPGAASAATPGATIAAPAEVVLPSETCSSYPSRWATGNSPSPPGGSRLQGAP